MPLKLVVLSPEKKILEADVARVTLPGTSGQITILPRHIPLFTQIGGGELIAIDTSGKELSLAVGGGFANIHANTVTVLADFGAATADLDERQIAAAKSRAEEVLKTMADDKTSALAQADLAKSILQLKVLNRRHRRS